MVKAGLIMYSDHIFSEKRHAMDKAEVVMSACHHHTGQRLAFSPARRAFTNTSCMSAYNGYGDDISRKRSVDFSVILLAYSALEKKAASEKHVKKSGKEKEASLETGSNGDSNEGGGNNRQSEKDMRRKLLKSFYEEMHKNGYHQTSVDDISQNANVTKGSFYHHFKSKEEAGLAVINELIAKILEDIWVAPLTEAEDVLEALGKAVKDSGVGFTADNIQYGCPLNNLAQEMSSLNEDFRKSISALYTRWHGIIVETLEIGKKRGQVKQDIISTDIASFIVAVVEGAIGMAKNRQDIDWFHQCCSFIASFLETLRA